MRQTTHPIPTPLDFQYYNYYNYNTMPMPLNDNTIDMMDLRSQPGTVVDQVFYRNASFVIRRKGQPRAVIVPLGEYAAMQRRRQAAKARFFALTDELQARFANEDPAKVQQTIDDAIAAVRRENKSAHATG